MSEEEALMALLEWRGVETPCKDCFGMGRKIYASTALWRGGIGGAAMTPGVCDKCWGSGDANRPWTDIKKLEQELRRLRAIERGLP